MSKFSLSHLVPAARFVVLAACFASAPVFLLAQGAAEPQSQATDQAPPAGGMGRGAEMQQRQLDHLTHALNLTSDQVDQVKAIQNDGHQQMLALPKNTALSAEDRHTQMMALHQSEMTRVQAILTAEQKTKFEQMRARMDQRREEHRGAEQAPPPPPPGL